MEDEEEDGTCTFFVCCCKHITRGSVCVCDTCHTCNDALNLRHLLLMKSIDVIYLVAIALVVVGGVLRCHAVVFLRNAAQDNMYNMPPKSAEIWVCVGAGLTE